MENAKQHFIPVSYLNAWCDPDRPSGHDPYVWVFSKDGSTCLKRSPKKLFRANNIYTDAQEDGKRNLTLERVLSRVEQGFAGIRRLKIDESKPLSPDEWHSLCLFAAAMYSRTPRHGEHWRHQWNQILLLVDRMNQVTEQMTAEERAELAASLSNITYGDDSEIPIETVRKSVEKPILTNTAIGFPLLAVLLLNIPVAILCAAPSTHFITSDAPCTWYDPAHYDVPPSPIAGGLASPTLDIVLPLSPTHALWFGRLSHMNHTYFRLSRAIANTVNRRTRLYAHEFFVSNRAAVDGAWF